MFTDFDAYNDWSRTLVDTIYRLPSSYGPSDLVSTSAAGLNGGYAVRAFVIPDLAQMAAAARDAGAPFGVVSAYRSYWTQVSTFNSWVSETGYEDALLVSARPGHSEHQLGTTLDLKTAGGPDPWDIDFGNTAAGSWLRANAWRFGFVMSYPAGPSPSITCYAYEPWHFRYFGRELAAAMHDSGLTSREYLWGHGSAMAAPPAPSATPAPRPRRVSTASGSDRPPKGSSAPPVEQFLEPEPQPAVDPGPETVAQDDVPEVSWPTWLVERAWRAQWQDFGGPGLAGEAPEEGAQAPPGESAGGPAPNATGANAAGDRGPTGNSASAEAIAPIGQLGVLAGLVIGLAVDSRARRRLTG